MLCYCPAMEPQIRFCESADGFRIAYTVFGTGPPLLVTPHGSLAMEYEFEESLGAPYFEALADRFTVAYFDARGVGRSGKTAPSSRVGLDSGNLAALDAADVAAVAAAARFERFSLYASCLLGPGAIEFAAQHPSSINALALFATTCHGASAFQPEVIESLSTMMRSHWPMATRTGADLWAPGLSGSKLEAMARGMRNSMEAETAARRAEQLHASDARAPLARIQVPVLAMHRAGDRITPSDEAARIAAGCPDGRFQVLAGDDHWQWLGDTDQVLTLLFEFLGAGPGASPPSANPLSRRETEVIALVAAGLTNANIAEQLTLSVFTVNRHVSNILEKLDVANRTEAAGRATELGLI